MANTADDIWLHGLKVSPDLDTVMYTLGGGIDAGAWVGPHGRDLAREGGAGGVRSRADLVRAGRPRPGHPPRPHADARGRLPAVRGDRGAVPAVAARRTAAADERRPGGDPRRRRRRHRALRPPGRALPGVLDPAPALRCPPVPSSPSGSTPQRRRPVSSRRSPSADVVVLPPSNPVVSIGTIVGVVGDPRRPGADRRRPSWASPPSSAGSHVRGMAEQLLTALGVEVSAAGVAEHYGVRATAACSTAGWSTSGTPTRWPAWRQPESPAARCR